MNVKNKDGDAAWNFASVDEIVTLLENFGGVGGEDDEATDKL